MKPAGRRAIAEALSLEPTRMIHQRRRNAAGGGAPRAKPKAQEGPEGDSDRMTLLEVIAGSGESDG